MQRSKLSLMIILIFSIVLLIIITFSAHALQGTMVASVGGGLRLLFGFELLVVLALVVLGFSDTDLVALGIIHKELKEVTSHVLITKARKGMEGAIGRALRLGLGLGRALRLGLGLGRALMLGLGLEVALRLGLRGVMLRLVGLGKSSHRDLIEKENRM